MQDTPPKLAYWHVWTDDDGLTHQTRCELSAFHLHRMAADAAPQWNDLLVTSDATVIIANMPVGWIGEVARESKTAMDRPAIGPLVRRDHGWRTRGDGAGRSLVRG